MKIAASRSKSVKRANKGRRVPLTVRVEVLEDEVGHLKADVFKLKDIPAQLLRLQNDFTALHFEAAEKFSHLEALFLDQTEQMTQMVADSNDKIMKALGGLPCSRQPADTQPYEPVEAKK